MRSSVLVVCLAALAPSAQGFQLDFSPPAAAGPNVASTGSQWLFLVFDSPSFTADLSMSHQVIHETFREAGVLVEDPLTGPTPVWSPTPGHTQYGNELQATIEALGMGSLYLQAQSISWNVSEATTLLKTRHGGLCFDRGIEHVSLRDRLARYEAICPLGDVALHAYSSGAQMPISLVVSGLEFLETHNVAYACMADSARTCPRSPHRESWRAPGPLLVESRDFRFHRLTGELILDWEWGHCSGLLRRRKSKRRHRWRGSFSAGIRTGLPHVPTDYFRNPATARPVCN